MAERMTRDEHIQNAADFAREANALATQMIKARSREWAPMVSALVEVARLHIELAGIPDRQPDAESAPVWVQQPDGSYRRDPVWLLIHIGTPKCGFDTVGWYAFGPGFSKYGCWVGKGITTAQVVADTAIDSHQANPETGS